MKTPKAIGASQRKFFLMIRKKLPTHYAALVAGNAAGVSIRQVRAVFRGEITNPFLVEAVKDSALMVASHYAGVLSLKPKARKAKKKKKTNL